MGRTKKEKPIELIESEINLIKFRNMVRRRNGVVTTKELFVDLITIWNSFEHHRTDWKIHERSATDQIKYMWEFVREYEVVD
jgi:hypothetical protein